MSEPRNEEFKAELKSLLEKYEVEISWECGEGSDTHGIYGEKMVAYFFNDRLPVILNSEGGCIDRHVL